MKKVLWLAVLILAGVYGTGYASLGEGGVNRFLNHWEQLSVDGNADAVCDLMHDEIEVSLDDRSGAQAVRLQGGKKEFCDYNKQAIPAMKLVLSSMTTTRTDLNVRREWLHPWTAEVDYTERRSMSMAGLGVQINTLSEDRITLVRTFGGVKLKSVESTTWLDQG